MIINEQIINEQIKKNHEALSKTNLKFLEFVQKNPWCLKHSLYDELKWPWTFLKIIFQPWPVYINQHLKKEASDASVTIFNLIKHIPGKIFNFDTHQMGLYYGIPHDTMKYILAGVTEDNLEYLLGRGDFVYAPTLGFKCIEYNITGNLGCWELPFWHAMYSKNTTTAKFLEENHPEIINDDIVTIALQSYINNLLKKFPRQDTEMNIAIVMARHQDGIMDSPVEKCAVSRYREILQSMNKNLQGELIVCDYGHLTVKNNRVYHGDKPILLIHENYAGFVPDDILNVFHKGNLVLNVGPLTFLTTNKLNIALLSEHEESELFTPEERQSITKYIPWTRKTTAGKTRFRGDTIELESFVLANKEKFVLKPALNYGGKQIRIGLHTTPQDWEREIKAAFRQKTWLVQEYLPSPGYLFQDGVEGIDEHNIVWGMFVFGDTYAGSVLRTLSSRGNKGIINVHQGADLTIVFEVRE